MSNYRIEKIVGGYAVQWRNETGVQNAIIITHTEDQAQAWINNRPSNRSK
jgi:hypothetical protein